MEHCKCDILVKTVNGTSLKPRRGDIIIEKPVNPTQYNKPIWRLSGVCIFALNDIYNAASTRLCLYFIAFFTILSLPGGSVKIMFL